MASNLETVLRRAVDLNVRFYSDVARLSVDYLRDLTGTLREVRTLGKGGGSVSVSATEAAATRVLVLEGAAGTAAAREFAITNHLQTVVSTRIMASPFVASNGDEADIEFTFDPDEVSLHPGEQVFVRVTVPIPETLRAGISYRGDFSVPDLSGARIPVIVRRRHDVE